MVLSVAGEENRFSILGTTDLRFGLLPVRQRSVAMPLKLLYIVVTCLLLALPTSSQVSECGYVCVELTDNLKSP